MKRLVVLLTLVMGLLALPAAADEVTFLPPGQTIQLPGIANVQIMYEGPPTLGSWDMTLNWNPAIVDFGWGTINLDPFATDPAGQTDVLWGYDLGPGWLNVWLNSLVPPDQLVALQPAFFRMLDLNFSAVGFGTTPLIIGRWIAADENGIEVSGLIELSQGSITVQNVPEPATMALLFSGIGLGALKRFRRK